MTPPMFVLYVTCLLLGRMADMTALDISSSHLKSVNVGEDVTLECFYKDTVAVRFYWYKQTLGQKPNMMSKLYKHEKNGTLSDEFKNDPRFVLETATGKNNLKISGVQISDSATYHCISGYSYVFEFLESVTVSVKGSGLNNQALVHQSESETIQPGGSVTLNCTVHTETCDGEHSVYWFKSSEDSQPRIIYTHGDRNDHLSHAGTYYCAVASCGHILFGNGTKLDFKDEADSLVLYFLSGALTFTTILAVFLANTAYRMYKTNSCQCTDSQARSAAASAPNTEGHQDADNLHYAALREYKVSRSRRQRDDTKSECVYSSVKQQK
uniref:Ig-like domain-containing protein n=1 Tax=Lates calcarifer TaxID=8187 RepID=A0A4W6DGG8_LATCA